MHWLQKYVLSGVVQILGSIPISIRSAIGKALGWLFSFIPTREREIAKHQLECFLPEQGGSKLIPKVYSNLGAVLFESFNLLPMLKRKERFIHHRDTALLEEIRTSNRGTVVLSAHLSNWELLAYVAADYGIKVATIGRPVRIAYLQPMLKKLRERLGIKTIWRGDPQAQAKSIKLLRAGWTLGVLIDQDTKVKSVHVPFFGKLAKTPSTAITLAKRTGARIVAAFIVRIGYNKYETRLYPLDERKSTREILCEYNRILENLIREFPSQWVWIHKRWRTLPNGDKLNSVAYLEYLKSNFKHV